MTSSAPQPVIDLRKGHPDPNLFPGELMREATASLLSSSASAQEVAGALGYGKKFGNPNLRASLAELLNTQMAEGPSGGETSRIEADQIACLPGASYAMAACMNKIPGGIVLVETPTYYLASQVFSGFQTLAVETDEFGMTPRGVTEAVGKHKDQVKGIYIIPSYHNPTGRTMPVSRRKELIGVCSQNGIIIVADEVYQLLHWGSHPPPLMVCFDNKDGGCVVSVGSFSKLIGPGLRMGYLISKNQDMLDRIMDQGFFQSGGGLCPYSGAIVQETLRTGTFVKHLNEMRTEMQLRCNTILQTLADNLTVGEVNATSGGYFIWVSFKPGQIDTKDLDQHLEDEGVFVRLYPMPDGTQGVRLCFAFLGADLLEKGTRIFCSVIRQRQLEKSSL